MSTQNGIQVDTLQKSVKDAVKVTRKLGFKYLWVDAFCIIQDCDRDKEKEVGRMATIYKNAAITIAAGTAERASDGFLGQRSTYIPESVVGGDGVLEYLQPLEGLPWTSFNEDNAGLFGSDDEEKMYLWKTIVWQYTRRLLTNADDRLNALRGITRELEVLWEDSNFFGLWKKWFVELLAWYKSIDADVGEEESQRSDRAPSWSWASLSRQVKYTEMFIKEDAKVKGWDTLGTRVPRHAVLECRMMTADDLGADQTDEDGDIISGGCDKLPDLKKDASEKEVQGREIHVLLLGTIFRDRRKLGVGLMVVNAGNGFYQRVGMAELEDLDAWEGVGHQEINLK
ncbi:hypothetical protein COL940_009948 [Colletotrichum noveboracense]|nr:hypothetical protein COL940_009948 [Colletotrichum noveboracense]